MNDHTEWENNNWLVRALLSDSKGMHSSWFNACMVQHTFFSWPGCRMDIWPHGGVGKIRYKGEEWAQPSWKKAVPAVSNTLLPKDFTFFLCPKISWYAVEECFQGKQRNMFSQCRGKDFSLTAASWKVEISKLLNCRGVRSGHVLWEVGWEVV